MKSIPRFSLTLWLLDLAALTLNTWVGFASHGEATAWGRMPSTWVPLVVAWTAAAYPLGLFTPAPRSAWPRRALHLLWAGLLAAPLAAWLRGLWLGAAIPPLFPPVLGAFTVLFVALLRGAYALGRRRA